MGVCPLGCFWRHPKEPMGRNRRRGSVGHSATGSRTYQTLLEDVGSYMACLILLEFNNDTNNIGDAYRVTWNLIIRSVL
ncbi:hypothetical protein KQX54_004534 [Cotesia glomerata]|uniref:Uncharacterized protein n=1 Tax=Cotesia glomerata TaxID=32391 RepID=A0AAV7HX96_COTGL|nr:hypothetical protein KQX54_004534 [Cotesia glomerata]